MTMPFAPTPFATPVVSASAGAITQHAPLIGCSEYRFAPTAVGTGDLVPGSTNPASDSLAALAQVIARASVWADQTCFHGRGTLAAMVRQESGWVKVKDSGIIPLVSSVAPVSMVLGVALGPSPGNLTSIQSPASEQIWVEGQVIWLPNFGSWGPVTVFPTIATQGSGIFAVWDYVGGFPHASLAQDAPAGATTLTLAPADPASTMLAGFLTGTALTIRDGASTERVVVSSVAGTTITLASPTLYAHTVPAAPDTIMVSALPDAVEQAVISITSVLIKTRGTRAQILPAVPGRAANRQALAQAGALEDYELARRLLQPYIVPFLGHH